MCEREHAFIRFFKVTSPNWLEFFLQSTRCLFLVCLLSLGKNNVQCFEYFSEDQTVATLGWKKLSKLVVPPLSLVKQQCLT